MNNETPSRAGWRVARENPKLVLIEVSWRWSFGVAALLLLLLAGVSTLKRVSISDADWAVLRSFDPYKMANTVAALVVAYGKPLSLVLVALLFALAFLWMIAATWGRAATLKILRGSGTTATVTGLNLLRILLLLAALVVAALATIGAAMLATHFSSDPEEPNLLVYFSIVVLVLPVIVILWAVLNWVLSLAPLFALGEQGVLAAVAATFRSLRAQRKAYWSVSGVYGTIRGAGLLVLIVFGLAMGAVGQDRIIFALLVALLLLYFFFADLLYVARLAAYLQIVEKLEQLPVASNRLPV
ncbi:MAG TPA: hypothetical protein VK699_16660 [Terriglobales bacterium]|jgi:hypothetical protein|nr:hypothetical protein [Terriglobales bacterium]